MAVLIPFQGVTERLPCVFSGAARSEQGVCESFPACCERHSVLLSGSP